MTVTRDYSEAQIMVLALWWLWLWGMKSDLPNIGCSLSQQVPGVCPTSSPTSLSPIPTWSPRPLQAIPKLEECPSLPAASDQIVSSVWNDWWNTRCLLNPIQMLSSENPSLMPWVALIMNTSCSFSLVTCLSKLLFSCPEVWRSRGHNLELAYVLIPRAHPHNLNAG